jgi:integrase
LKRARVQSGSVVLNKRYATWNLLWVDGNRRRSKLIGTVDQYRTRDAALKAAETMRNRLFRSTDILVPRLRTLVNDWKNEKMSTRFSTRTAYQSWLNNHVLPHWGHCTITELQPRPVELWLNSSSLSPKSRVHIRGLIRQLWEYAMWRGDIAAQRNPMELVSIRAATRRLREPRSLTAEEFHRFLQHLEEPVRTIALVCLCFGLRISECLGLKWADIDWLNAKLRVERAIVRQRIGDVKTIYSGKLMSIDTEMLVVFKSWRHITQFAGENDWVFASPVKLGRLPVSYPWVWKAFQQATVRSGIEKLGTHSLRHTYRSWLDAVGTPIAVQQKLMRHSDIRTTLNIYGDVVTDEMAQAHAKVVRLAIPRVS